MPGRAIISNVSFGDTTLPKIDITYIPPLVGATYDFAVDQLPLGPVASWPSLVDTGAFVADGATVPQVITDGASKTVRFNGTVDRMKLTLNMNTAHSVVVVAKLRAPIANDQIFFGSTANTEGAIGVAGNGTSWAGYGGGAATLTMNPPLAPDANWHVFILSHQGTSSAVRVDSAETPGNLPVAQRNGITLGFAAAGDLRADIDYKRIAVIPGVMTVAQRAAIVAQLKGQYGI